MSPRSGGLALSMALAFVSVALLAPLASADHSYSHRLVIYGRVVDSEGNAVQGYTVDFRSQHFQHEGACSPNQPNIHTDAFGPTYTRPITNEYGEFIFCLHAHSMSRFEPGTGFFRVSTPQGVDVANHEMALNGFSRIVFAKIQLDTAVANAPSTLDETYTVAGRLWRSSGEQKVEGITVFGDTIQNEMVNVTLTYGDGKTVTQETRTNGYGDFSLRFPVDERPTSGTVTITAANETFTSPVDATFAFSTFDARYAGSKSLPNATMGLVAAVLAITALLAPAGRRRG